MNRVQVIICIILISIPVGFGLFLLAMINVLLFLLGIIAVLIGVLLLRRHHPEWLSIKKEETASKTIRPSEPTGRPVKAQVYMVLAGREDFGVRRIVVNKTAYSIGRGMDNDFVIDGMQISRHHLKIEFNSVENVCYAIDMDSANKTYLNSEPMVPGQRYKLIEGDHIMIDDRTFIVEYARY